MKPARIVLNRRIKSLTGQPMKEVIPKGRSQVVPGLQKPLAINRLRRRFIGAVKLILPAVVGIERRPFLGISLRIKVPRNFILPRPVLEMRVFEVERVSFNDLRNSAISDLRAKACCLDPQRPISQSSA